MLTYTIEQILLFFVILLVVVFFFIFKISKSYQSQIEKLEKEKETNLNKANQVWLNIQAKENALDLKLREFPERERKLKADIDQQIRRLEQRKNEIYRIEQIAKSNLSAIPYMAAIVTDFDLRNIDIFSYRQIGKNIQKNAAEELVQTYKEYSYQLSYIKKIFPELSDFISCDFNKRPRYLIRTPQKFMYDMVQEYTTAIEFNCFNTTDRNQIALDNYNRSNKTNQQIGRDYEMYVSYVYRQKGYKVDEHGAANKTKDRGRDLIAHSASETLIVQCKYWAIGKEVQEKTICQLYGTTTVYEREYKPKNKVRGVLITNVRASEEAKKFAFYLGIEIKENVPLRPYPSIKCYRTSKESSTVSKRYSLPFDPEYDEIIINESLGDMWATTVLEAESKGFTRNYR